MDWMATLTKFQGQYSKHERRLAMPVLRMHRSFLALGLVKNAIKGLSCSIQVFKRKIILNNWSKNNRKFVNSNTPPHSVFWHFVFLLVAVALIALMVVLAFSKATNKVYVTKNSFKTFTIS